MNNNKIDADSIVCRVSAVAFSKLDDELLAIDAQAGYCYSMNETAGRVWELVASPVSVRDICAQLCAEYAVDQLCCQEEVLPLLCGLLESGLISVSSG